MVWVALLLVVAPIVELWFIIQTADVIGGWQTLALLVAMGLLGGWLIKREGRSVMTRIDERLKANQLPTKELADGFLLLVAGLLMLTPGFIGDVIGLLLLLPPTRAVARAALLAPVHGPDGHRLHLRVVVGVRRRRPPPGRSRRHGHHGQRGLRARAGSRPGPRRPASSPLRAPPPMSPTARTTRGDAAVP